MNKTIYDASDLKKFRKEYRHFDKLMDFIQADKKFSLIPIEAPEFYKALKSFGDCIKRKIAVCEW